MCFALSVQTALLWLLSTLWAPVTISEKYSHCCGISCAYASIYRAPVVRGSIQLDGLWTQLAGAAWGQFLFSVCCLTCGWRTLAEIQPGSDYSSMYGLVGKDRADLNLSTALSGLTFGSSEWKMTQYCLSTTPNKPLSHFLIKLFVFLLLSYMSSLYIFYFNHLSYIQIIDIFP